MTTMQSTNLATVQAAYADFGRGDIPAVLAVMQPDIEWIEQEGGPYAGRYVGPDAVATGVFARVPEDWSDFAVTPDEFLEAGDVVVVLGWFTGTHAATGRSLRARFAHVIRMKDGLEASFEDITDTHGFHLAMNG